MNNNESDYDIARREILEMEKELIKSEKREVFYNKSQEYWKTVRDIQIIRRRQGR